MAFDRNGFIRAAKEQGYDEGSINAELKRLGQKPIGLMEKIVESPALPVGGGAVGMLAGGPVGAALGAFTGTNIQNSAKNLMGINKPATSVGEATGNVMNQFSEAGANGLAGGGIAGLFSALNYLRPSQLAETVRSKTQQAGAIPDASLEREFGTSGQPNPDLYKGLKSAGDEFGLVKKLQGEIASQGRGAATYEDALNYRQGAYKQGYGKEVPKPLQGLYQNIGRAYSNIVHEVPGTKIPDAIYGMEKKVGGAGKRLLPYIGGALLLGEIRNLVSSLHGKD